MAANITLIKKLQQAINGKGGQILYNTSQWYSKEQDRPVTIYIIRKYAWDAEKQKDVSYELYSSTSQIQIVLFLRDYWYEMNGWEVPTDNEEWNKAKAYYYSKENNRKP